MPAIVPVTPLSAARALIAFCTTVLNAEKVVVEWLGSDASAPLAFTVTVVDVPVVVKVVESVSTPLLVRMFTFWVEVVARAVRRWGDCCSAPFGLPPGSR